MLTLLHRFGFCRCFGRPRPVGFPAADVRWDEALDAPRAEFESCLSLRPGVDCLDKWIDLNA